MISTSQSGAPPRPRDRPCAPLPAPPPAGRFIAVTLSRLEHGAAGLPLALAAFDVERFVPRQFADYGIHHPPALHGRALKRQAEYLAGRVCARAVLDAHGQHGFVLHAAASRAPLWPAGIVGSISHNRRYAGAVAAPSADLLGIGIDIEAIMSIERATAIGGAIMTPAEQVRLGATNTSAFARLVTLVFSAKESFYKAAFAEVGALFGFDAVELVHIDLVQATLGFRCVRDLASRIPAGMAFTAGFRMLDPATVLTSVRLEQPGSFER